MPTKNHFGNELYLEQQTAAILDRVKGANGSFTWNLAESSCSITTLPRASRLSPPCAQNVG